MTTAQSRTLDEQIAHEDALIDSWHFEDKGVTDLSDLDDEQGFRFDDGDFDEEEDEDELFNGDHSLD